MDAQPRILVLADRIEALDSAMDSLRPLAVELHGACIQSDEDLNEIATDSEWRAILCAGAVDRKYTEALRAKLPPGVKSPILLLAEPGSCENASSAAVDGCFHMGHEHGLCSSVERVLGLTASPEAQLPQTIRDAILQEIARRAVITTDAAGRITFASESAESVLNCAPQESHGRLLSEALLDEAIPAEFLRDLFDGACRDGRHERWLPSGKMRLVVLAVEKEPEESSGFVLSWDRRPSDLMREDSLLRAQKMEAIEALTRGITHDFNNLLTAIFGYTDLAKSTLPVDHEAIQALALVEQAARQAQGVAKSLLAFTRQGSAAKEPLDLTIEVAEALKLTRHALPANIEVVGNIPRDEHILVNANSVQLQQIMMNLAINARDAMPNGGKLSVDLVAERTAGSDKGRAVLRFCDEGLGMEADVVRRAAEPFFTTKSRSQHSGLGLSVAQGIIVDHGGTLDLVSCPGTGSTISLSLPLCAAPLRAEADEIPRGTGELILIVEKDDQVRSIMVSALRSAGYETVTSPDSQFAAEQLHQYQNRIELLILDLDMPEADQLECLKAIQPDKLPVPTIVALNDPAPDAVLAAECEVLQKPFRMTDLVACVTRKLAANKKTKEQ